jgi:steroid 5-alpha reductase family enzyme
MTRLVLTGWAVLALVLAALWLRQLRTRNATSVDVAWSAGLLFLSVLYPWFVEGDVWRRGLVAVLGGAWALRLAWYLYSKRVLGHAEEDGRYRAMRAELGARAPLVFFFFYQGQAAVAVLFSLPMLAAMQGTALGPLAVVGAIVWLVAVAGESVADGQLTRFRADSANKGLACREGLWRYSRHPNYFFEWVHWWSYVLIGEGAALTWLGPVAMLVFLFRLTGIPYTEMQALRSRGDAYREYQRTTSVFFPWWPKVNR